MEPYEKIFVQPAFLKSAHGQIPCETCHGGNSQDPDWRSAHDGLKPDPSFPDPVYACGDCHPDISRSARQSLHYTLDPMRQTVAARAGGVHPITRTAFDRHCGGCHASCGQCHISRPDYVGGGFLAGHRMLKTPPMESTCAACHGGRVVFDYTGQHPDNPPDIHYEAAEMTCTDCHEADELHGDGTGVSNRYRYSLRPACTDCHPMDTSPTPVHRNHTGRVACQVCHGQAAKHCFQCHVGTDREGLPYFKCRETRVAFHIGLDPGSDPNAPSRFTVLRHPPASPGLFDAYGPNLLPRFNTLPTWKPDTPHNIRRVTPRNRDCINCHGQRALFLRVSDLEFYERQANQRIVVPDHRVPKVDAITMEYRSP